MLTSYIRIFSYSEMPRKLKYYQPKNYERKKTHKRKELSFIISIPYQLIQAPQLTLTLSLPISAFVTAPVTDLCHLNTRLSMQSLPNGWVRHMNELHNGLIFSSLSIDSFALLPITTFIVKIDCDLKWSLSYNGITVKNQQLRKRLITKEHIATHTHLNFKFKPALYSSTLVITLFNTSTKLKLLL